MFRVGLICLTLALVYCPIEARRRSPSLPIHYECPGTDQCMQPSEAFLDAFYNNFLYMAENVTYINLYCGLVEIGRRCINKIDKSNCKRVSYIPANDPNQPIIQKLCSRKGKEAIQNMANSVCLTDHDIGKLTAYKACNSAFSKRLPPPFGNLPAKTISTSAFKKAERIFNKCAFNAVTAACGPETRRYFQLWESAYIEHIRSFYKNQLKNLH